MIHFLLGISDQQEFKDLLQTADYIETTTGELTAAGFQFVLMDQPSQVHQILLQYLKRGLRRT